MLSVETVVARLLCGIPVEAALIEALPEPGREIARRVDGANGEGPRLFEQALDELVADPAAREKFVEDVFHIDPCAPEATTDGAAVAGPALPGAGRYAGQYKVLPQALRPRPQLPSIVKGLLPARSVSTWPFPSSPARPGCPIRRARAPIPAWRPSSARCCGSTSTTERM